MDSQMTSKSRRQTRLLFPLGVAVALSLTGDQTLYAVLGNQASSVGISLAAVGILLAANRIIRIPGNLVAGALNDRHRRRPLFLLGLSLGIISTLSYAYVRGFAPFLASRLLWGASWALINVTGYTMILDWSSQSDRGRMAGFSQGAYALGLAFSPLLGGLLTDSVGFRSAVRIGAAISALGLVLATVALPETKPPVAECRPALQSSPRVALGKMAGAWRHMDRRIWLAGYTYMVTFLVNSGILMSTIGLYLKERWTASITASGLVVGVATLAGLMLALRASLGALAGPAAGALSDRRGERWPVIREGLLLGMAGFTLLAVSGSVLAVPSGVALIAVSAGALLATVAALVGDLAPEDRPGATMGGLATAGDIGSALGPLLAYSLAVVLDLRWVYLLSAHLWC
jgi:MFS family permease